MSRLSLKFTFFSYLSPCSTLIDIANSKRLARVFRRRATYELGVGLTCHASLSNWVVTTSLSCMEGFDSHRGVRFFFRPVARDITNTTSPSQYIVFSIINEYELFCQIYAVTLHISCIYKLWPHSVFNFYGTEHSRTYV